MVIIDLQSTFFVCLFVFGSVRFWLNVQLLLREFEMLMMHIAVLFHKIGTKRNNFFFFFFSNAVGTLLGAMTGALIGQETESGFVRGAAVGAISGAVFSIEVFESSLVLWQSDESGIGCLLYLVSNSSFFIPHFCTCFPVCLAYNIC